MNLIEVLALLKPQVLPAIRDAYSEMVSEGILMKKRMKGYFQALPGKNAAYTQFVSRDLKDYTQTDSGSEKTVNASDIGAALGELLPVVSLNNSTMMFYRWFELISQSFFLLSCCADCSRGILYRCSLWIEQEGDGRPRKEA
jgi:hypothetical protein